MIERLTTTEAAHRFGISPATVRRLIAAGTLPAEREVRPQGTRWLVLLDTSAGASLDSKPRVTSVQRDRDALAVALETIADLRRRLDAAEQAQAELRQLLAREQETVKLLQAGDASTPQSSARVTSHDSAHDVSAVSAPPASHAPPAGPRQLRSERRRPPRWRVWLRTLLEG